MLVYDLQDDMIREKVGQLSQKTLKDFFFKIMPWTSNDSSLVKKTSSMNVQKPKDGFIDFDTLKKSYMSQTSTT